MFGWISKSAIPNEDSIIWILETYAWLLEHTGGYSAFEKNPLVLPTEEFFPIAPDLDGHDLALALFECTKKLSGLKEWSCRLVAHREGPSVRDLLGNVPFEDSGRKGAAGTFSITRRSDVKITYSPSSLDDPVTFVATMAHELSHYLMATFPAAPPGGEEAYERATDLCAVFLGFGVFASNAAFSFQQYTDGLMQGWSMSRQGYLDEKMLSYALAVFVELRGIRPDAAARHLKTNPRSYLKHAVREVRRNRKDGIAKLRAVNAASTPHSGE